MAPSISCGIFTPPEKLAAAESSLPDNAWLRYPKLQELSFFPRPIIFDNAPKPKKHQETRAAPQKPTKFHHSKVDFFQL